MEIQHFFHTIKNIISRIGDFTLFSIKATLLIFRRPHRTHLFVEQLTDIGLASIPVVSLSNFAIGMVFSLQLTVELVKFSATSFSANILAQTLTREISPLITLFMLIAKNGSAFTAEIGTMNINNQINALKTMTVNPLQYVVSPRLFAFTIMAPILTGLANLLGMFGGALILFGMMKIDYASSTSFMWKGLEPADIISGIVKSMIMGYVVCLICCYYGFISNSGAKGVGKSTTKAVVTSYITILLLDLVLGQFFISTGITK